MAALFQEGLNVAIGANAVKPTDLANAIVDTTMQSKGARVAAGPVIIGDAGYSPAANSAVGGLPFAACGRKFANGAVAGAIGY